MTIRIEERVAPQHCDLLVKDATVVSVDAQRRIFRRGAIAVVGSRIAEVGPSADLEQRWQPNRAIDGRNKVATPGLVNGHLHMSQHLFRGVVPDDVGTERYLSEWSFPYYLTLTPEDEALAVSLACADALLTGTTLVAEAGTLRYPMECAAAIEGSGLRAVVGQWAMDLAPEWPELGGTSTDVALTRIDSLLAAVGTDVRQRVSAYASVIGMGTCSDALLQGARMLADERDTVINMHQSYSQEEIERYRELVGFAGDPVAHLDEIGVLTRRTRLVHMLHTAASTVELLRARGSSVVHCDTTALKLAMGAIGHSAVPEMVEAGVPVALGTDTANVSNTSDILRCAHMTACVFKDARGRQDVLPAETMLEMCTIGGARSVGAEGNVGSLAAGHEADLVLFDADRPEWIPNVDPVNNLIYSADAASVHTVIVGGEVVVEDGRLTQLDEEQLYHDARSASARILGRLGRDARPRWPVIG